MTDDSGQALDLPPNPALLAIATVSADNLISCLQPLWAGRSPFRSGVRSGSEQRARLLLASAPLPRKIQSRALRRQLPPKISNLSDPPSSNCSHFVGAPHCCALST